MCKSITLEDRIFILISWQVRICSALSYVSSLGYTCNSSIKRNVRAVFSRLGHTRSPSLSSSPSISVNSLYLKSKHALGCHWTILSVDLELWRSKVSAWVGDQLGKAYSFNNSGDGPESGDTVFHDMA